MQAARGAEGPAYSALAPAFSQAEIQTGPLQEGIRHLPGAFLAIVAPLLCPRRRVFGVTKCKSHFPPSWLDLSLHSGLCLFSSPQLVLQCPGELGGAGSPSWFHLPLIRPCGAFGVSNPPNEVPAPSVLRRAQKPQPSIPFPRNAGDELLIAF